MRKNITFLLLGLMLSLKLIAQDEPSPFEVNFFPSVHFGFFTGADDVNEYIKEDLSNASVEFGTTDLIMNFTLGVGVGFRFANLVELQPIVEYSLGPKIISGGVSKTYNFNKFSGGMMANFMIPISYNRKSSILVGAGMFYNNMKFEGYSGNAINPRFQVGFSLNNNRFNPQILLALDLAKFEPDDPNPPLTMELNTFELNYSSFRVGVNLNF